MTTTTTEQACADLRNGLTLALAANRVGGTGPVTMGALAEIVGVTSGSLAGYLSGRRGEPEDWGSQRRATPCRLTLARVAAALATGTPDGDYEDLTGALTGGSAEEIIQALAVAAGRL
jgi:hypothetical protein